MTEKQSILGRIAQLTRANINALLDRAEDPQKMLDQLVRDYTNANVEDEEARDWGNKALAASNKAEELRSSGNASEAQRFDDLAKIALTKQINAEKSAKDAEPVIASQNEVVDKLKSGLTQMRSQLEDLKSRRDQLVARQKTAEAQGKVQSAISSINVLDPTTEISRFEEQVRREEARVAGHAELNAGSLE